MIISWWRERIKRHNDKVEARIRREEAWFMGIKQGDIVKLKSGGPHMTVKRTVGYTAACDTGYPMGVHCSVFIRKVRDEYCFLPEELIIVRSSNVNSE